MSRSSIQPVIDAFIARRVKKVSNTRTDGTNLYLYDNLIAYWHESGTLRISSAGWRTVTTKDRLNGLPNVSITQKDYQWFLNGKYWDGDWAIIYNTEGQ